MKNQLLLACVSLLVMTSCVKTEIVDAIESKSQINFGKVQMGNNISSKANETLSGSETFGVYAFLTAPQTLDYISNEKLSQLSTSSWGLTRKYYYPIGAFSMDFWGWGKDVTKNIPTSISATGLTYTNYSVADQSQTADFEAFVVSKDKQTVTEANKLSPVSMRFWHALAKVKFTAKISSVVGFENVDVKISSVNMNTSDAGSLTYTGAGSKWEPGVKADKSVVVKHTSALTATQTDITDYLYVIPLAAEGMNTITVEAKLYNKNSSVEVGSVVGSFDAVATQLAINNSVTYNLVFDLSAAGLVEIKFAEPVVEDWNSIDASAPVK